MVCVRGNCGSLGPLNTTPQTKTCLWGPRANARTVGMTPQWGNRESGLIFKQVPPLANRVITITGPLRRYNCQSSRQSERRTLCFHAVRG